MVCEKAIPEFETFLIDIPSENFIDAAHVPIFILKIIFFLGLLCNFLYQDFIFHTHKKDVQNHCVIYNMSNISIDALDENKIGLQIIDCCEKQLNVNYQPFKTYQSLFQLLQYITPFFCSSLLLDSTQNITTDSCRALSQYVVYPFSKVRNIIFKKVICSLAYISIHL
jgi:hypothetical protein